MSFISGTACSGTIVSDLTFTDTDITTTLFELPRPSFDEWPKSVWIPDHDEKYHPKGYIRKSIHYQFKRMWK